MLVYAVALNLTSEGGLEQPLDVVAQWLSRKVRQPVTARELLSTGSRRFGDPLSSRCETLLLSSAEKTLFSLTLTHADSAVRGRQWITELGLTSLPSRRDIEVSVHVATSEISTLVATPVVLRPPRLVHELAEACPPTTEVPGVRLRRLTEEFASDIYLYEVLDPQRAIPLVMVSPAADGSYTADPVTLQRLLVGLAEVFVIPPDADTWAIARKFTSVPAPYGGAISIVMPRWRTAKVDRTPSVLLTQTELRESLAGAPEFEVVARVAHRMNLPMSWRHLSASRVRDSIRAADLAKARAALHAAPDIAVYEAMLSEAAAREATLAQQVADARAERDREWERAEQNDDDLRALKFDNESLRKALATIGTSTTAAFPQHVAALVAAAVRAKPSVASSLELIEQLFPDRLVVLESARRSASQHDVFRFGDQVFDLLYRLATGYWEALAAGQPDGLAKQVFGQHEFAAKEANLSSAGKRARTVDVPGVGEVFLEAHLKVQRGDNRAESFRCHFEWVAEWQKLVIGHCGEHLPL